ncbi:MAG: membrane protein insertase YidC [Candidatus Omnitrophica bacterium]|nr:membrane protein insertase YidC [Candidatus Omnitrophota bacterium]
MDRRTIIAILLSAAVLFVYQFYIMKHYPQDSLPAERGEILESEEIAYEVPVTATSYHPEEAEIRNAEPRHRADINAREIIYENDRLVVTLSSDGGYVKSILLKDYPDPKTGELYKLIDVSNPYYGILRLQGPEETTAGSYDLIEKKNEVLFTATIINGIEITKRFIFPEEGYHVALEVTLQNNNSTDAHMEYQIVAASYINIPSKLDRRYTHIVSRIDGKDRRDNGKKNGGIFEAGFVEYSGLQNKYFSVITKPATNTDGAWLRQTPDDNLSSSLDISNFTINANSSVSHSYILYAGPTKREILAGYELSGVVNHGMLTGISNILLSGLKFFHMVTRNWGIAIIMLAILVNLILFPLSHKSYVSMKKMQELQPHIDRLRNEHKDNPQRMNKEIMELYKQFNLNPLGGCLPMLLQFPVFIALWQALMRSLDLRGARFLWIRDLSMPDAVQLPFTLPIVGSTINILPILMTVAMVFQQRAMTRKNAAQSEQARQQQQIMVLMPIIFLFVMYSFPSGLVLYWLTNIFLTTFEQRVIMQR